MSVSTAEVGGLTVGAVASSGVYYVLQELDGWDSPVSTGSVEGRVGARGGWATRAYLGPRVMSLKGSLHVPEGGSLDDAIDALLAAIPLDEFQPMTVSRVGGTPRVINVRQDGDPSVSVVTKTYVTFDVPLIAEDPLKYSASESSYDLHLPTITGGLTVPVTVPFFIDATPVSGSVTAVNEGNFAAPFKVRIYGPAQDATITNATTGDRVTFKGSIAAGEFVDIDLDARTALLNGEASRRGSLAGRFFDLQPGPNEITFSAGFFNPSAHAVITWRSAWK